MKKITLNVSHITNEIFNPEKMELSVIEIDGETTKIFVELTQFYTDPNPGVCVMSRYYTISTSQLESLQINWVGEVTNNEALISLLSQFNLQLA